MSVIYKIECTECRNELTFTPSLDSDHDLIVEVEPCEECLKEAKEEGLAEGKEENN